MKCGVDCPCVKKPRVKKPKPDIVKKGAVYDVDGRKGLLTIRLREDVNLKDDTFFEAEIVSGSVSYASADNNLAQKLYDMGTPGTIDTFRTTLTHFKKRRFGSRNPSQGLFQMNPTIKARCTTCRKLFEMTPALLADAKSNGCAFSPCCYAVATVEHVTTRLRKAHSQEHGEKT